MRIRTSEMAKRDEGKIKPGEAVLLTTISIAGLLGLYAYNNLERNPISGEISGIKAPPFLTSKSTTSTTIDPRPTANTTELDALQSAFRNSHEKCPDSIAEAQFQIHTGTASDAPLVCLNLGQMTVDGTHNVLVVPLIEQAIDGRLQADIAEQIGDTSPGNCGKITTPLTAYLNSVLEASPAYPVGKQIPVGLEMSDKTMSACNTYLDSSGNPTMWTP